MYIYIYNLHINIYMHNIERERILDYKRCEMAVNECQHRNRRDVKRSICFKNRNCCRHGYILS